MPQDTAGSDDETDPDESETGRSGMTRRRLVASGAATWASVSLAGCNYITDPGVETPAVSTETTTTGNTSTTNETSNTTDSDGGTGDDSTDGSTEEETGTSCASIGRFSRGMEVGLHVAIYDPETGEPLGADAVDSVTIEFPDAGHFVGIERSRPVDDALLGFFQRDD